MLAVPSNISHIIAHRAHIIGCRRRVGMFDSVSRVWRDSGGAILGTYRQDSRSGPRDSETYLSSSSLVHCLCMLELSFNLSLKSPIKHGRSSNRPRRFPFTRLPSGADRHLTTPTPLKHGFLMARLLISPFLGMFMICLAILLCSYSLSSNR